MPRYDDRDRGDRGYRSDDRGYRSEPSERFEHRGSDDGATRLYVGRLSTRTRSRDLEDLFAKYGRIRDVDVKHDFAFVEFSDSRDADDARHYLNGKEFDGNRLIVEFARRGPRGPGGAREYLGRGPPPGTGRCYNCGNDGHWARDCKAGDWRDKCYRCGQRGHIERNCRNSPQLNSSRSRSRSRTPRGHGKSRRSLSRSRSLSYSHSPPRRGRSPVRDGRSKKARSRTRSMSGSLPPTRKRSISASPAGNGRSLSRSPLPRSESPPLHELRRDLSRSLSRSPQNGIEKDSSPKPENSPLGAAAQSGSP
ncbi:hypothetical protein CY35_08G001200 [Sphagnum magellanicum]|nr:hypothetical protein CY35_08G001200 [Sphagnum magellanicum]